MSANIKILGECPYCLKQWETTKPGLTNHIKYCVKNKIENNVEYICEKCNKKFLRKDGVSTRFCSRSCANSRIQTDDSKTKLSEALKSICLKFENKGRECENCKSIFHSKDMSRKLCFSCLPKTIKKVEVKKVPKSILDVSKRTSMKIVERMELPCSCCGLYIKGVHWDLHHIIPRKDGGPDDMTNITYICPNCHRIAHTDKNLLKQELISVKEQLENCDKNWLDFYYGYKGR